MALESSFIVPLIFPIMEVSLGEEVPPSQCICFQGKNVAVPQRLLSLLSLESREKRQILEIICFCILLILCQVLLSIMSWPGNKAVGVMKAGQTFTIEPMINAGARLLNL